MSYGCPIISTPVGGIPEVVTDNGILVTPGNSEEIFAAIRKYLDTPQLIEMEGEASLRNVSKHMPERVMNDLKDIYLHEMNL
jgi:glycosyltransferase involved in cell wall biosynthesis